MLGRELPETVLRRHCEGNCKEHDESASMIALEETPEQSRLRLHPFSYPIRPASGTITKSNEPWVRIVTEILYNQNVPTGVTAVRGGSFYFLTEVGD